MLELYNSIWESSFPVWFPVQSLMANYETYVRFFAFSFADELVEGWLD
jgi:hypothetical protein